MGKARCSWRSVDVAIVDPSQDVVLFGSSCGLDAAEEGFGSFGLNWMSGIQLLFDCELRTPVAQDSLWNVTMEAFQAAFFFTASDSLTCGGLTLTRIAACRIAAPSPCAKWAGTSGTLARVRTGVCQLWNLGL